MSKFLNAVALAGIMGVVGVAEAGKLGLGREATPEEVAGWDIDIRPDGQGLPVGSRSVEDGEAIYAEQCASCHGDFGEGVDNWPVLAGGMGTLQSEHPVKTIGSIGHICLRFGTISTAPCHLVTRSLSSRMKFMRSLLIF